MDTRLIGGALIIAGTSIGGGMLALPVSTAESGFLGALLLLFSTWLGMTMGAFLVLEVNLWFRPGSNLVTMASYTLGPLGALITWITYLLLFYSLLAAYIAGGGDLLQNLVFVFTKIHLSSWLAALLFLGFLTLVVYAGIRSIDYVNRGLMFGKLTAFVLLVVLMLPFVQLGQLSIFQPHYIIPAITIVVTSYGFATVIPSLRVYFHSDIKKLRTVIFVGSLIPLLCYLIWVGVVLGLLPLQGPHGLVNILESGRASSMLTEALIFYLQTPWINFLTRFFTSICMLTSFLGVALCLVDFLADGLGLRQIGTQKILVHVLALIPPLIIVLIYPNAFVLAISYAGVFCAILLMLLPAIMAWRGRYWHRKRAEYQVGGGKFLLIVVVLVAIFAMSTEILSHWFHI